MSDWRLRDVNKDYSKVEGFDKTGDKLTDRFNSLAL